MRPALALFALVALCASAPPSCFPGAEFLVLAGWMAMYALVDPRRCRRPLLVAYSIGVLHLVWFSLSLRHILLPAVLAIGALGGLYYVLTSYWTRALSRFVPGPLAFGVALAGACWLRANCPEIWYPHAQPVHCLYRWPALLGPLTLGSELLGNLLLGALCGAVVDAYRSWRTALPAWRRSLAVLAAALLAPVLGALPLRMAPPPDAVVRLLLVEPRLDPDQLRAAHRSWQDWAELMRARALEPAERLGAAQANGPQEPPELVVWPESIWLHTLRTDGAGVRVDRVRGFRMGRGVWLLQGTELRGSDGSRRVVALLVDEFGRYQGHHEKQRVVPGGEHQPFLDYLPAAAGEWVRRVFERAMGIRLPDIEPGEARPLLETRSKVRFGAMVCFDNAFPEVAEEFAAAGAAFLVVVSNESWYRGGAELAQMEAMTVCRALECRLPIVRCTVDGSTMAVGPDGRVLARLPSPAQSYASAEILAVDLPVHLAGVPAVPPLRPAVLGLVWLTLLTWLAPLRAAWGRLSRSSPVAGPDQAR